MTLLRRMRNTKIEQTMLWIATFFVPLHVLLHPSWTTTGRSTSCELLLFFYLCTFFYNLSEQTTQLSELWIATFFVPLHVLLQLDQNTSVELTVVNCYFFCNFARSFTTNQPNSNARYCCELLLFLYLCTFFYNQGAYLSNHTIVVNCYFFCTFARSFTTFATSQPSANVLWIATFFVPLHVLLQRPSTSQSCRTGCELLLFLYLCTFFYNW